MNILFGNMIVESNLVYWDQETNCGRRAGKNYNKRLSDSKPLFITDGLKFYAETLLKEYGEWVEFPKTGKRGRPKKQAIVTDEDSEYARVVKNKKGKKQKVKKRTIFGQNIDQK